MTRRRLRRGATAIELALVMPILATLLAGTVELSTMIGTSERVTTAVHEAAGVAAGVVEGPNPTGEQIVATAKAYVLDALTASGVTCDVDCTIDATWTEDPLTGLGIVRVTAAVPYAPFTKVGFPAAVLSAQATAVTQQP